MSNYIKEAFKDLTFKPDSHSYWLNDQKLRGTTTTIKDLFVKPFPYEVAKFSGAKRGLTEQEELLRWKTACEIACVYGTQKHEEKETEIKTNNLSKELEALFIKYGVKPVLTELSVYSLLNKFAGTFDLLVEQLVNGKYELWDWKTNKDIYKNFKYQCMLPPFETYLDMPLTHYKIQLSMYCLCLREIAKINISICRIVWLKQDNTIEVISFNCDKFLDTLKLCL